MFAISSSGHLENDRMDTAPQPVKATPGQTALGALVLVGLCGWGLYKCSGSERYQASTVVATIDTFRSGMPMLELEGMARTESGKSVDHEWKAKSGGNWIRFHDEQGDGALDRVVACLEWPVGGPDDSKAQMTSTMNLALVYRVIEIACGAKLDSADVSRWFTESIKASASAPVERTFGKTPVSMRSFVSEKTAKVLLTVGSPGVRR